MCSILEEELPQAVTSRLHEQQPTCKKCQTRPSSVNLRVADAYCSECFLTAVHHKFRATLGKHKAMRPGERVAVGFSGGQSSTCLAHLLHAGLESDVKRLMFVPLLVHVDCGAAYRLSEAERRQQIHETVARGVEQFRFPVYTVLLEDVVFPSKGGKEEEETGESRDIKVYVESDLSEIQFDTGRGEELGRIFSSVRDGTGEEDLFSSLLRGALLASALQLDCRKLFTGDNATNLSIQILAGVSAGQGSNLSHRTGFRDKRSDEVTILRPLRDVSAKEIALYSFYHRVVFATRPKVGTGKNSQFSIRKLTENFLTGLQADFPATLPTVFRTGDKLQVDGSEGGERCSVCGGHIFSSPGELNAQSATVISDLLSSTGAELVGDAGIYWNNRTTNTPSEGGDSAPAPALNPESKPPAPDVLALADQCRLCYSCSRTFKSFKSPEHVTSAFSRLHV